MCVCVCVCVWEREILQHMESIDGTKGKLKTQNSSDAQPTLHALMSYTWEQLSELREMEQDFYKCINMEMKILERIEVKSKQQLMY